MFSAPGALKRSDVLLAFSAIVKDFSFCPVELPFRTVGDCSSSVAIGELEAVSVRRGNSAAPGRRFITLGGGFLVEGGGIVHFGLG